MTQFIRALKIFLLAVYFTVVTVWVAPAFAGERLLGSLYVNDAGSVSNFTVHYLDGGWFPIPTLSKISLQCSAQAYVCVDKETCAAEAGPVIDASPVLFPTSLQFTCRTSAPAAITSGCVSVRPVSGAGLTCRVYLRDGQEM